MATNPNRSQAVDELLARVYVRSMPGVERVDIRDGEVHAYGVMPNTNQTGWYLAGCVDDLVAEVRALQNSTAMRERA